MTNTQRLPREQESRESQDDPPPAGNGARSRPSSRAGSSRAAGSRWPSSGSFSSSCASTPGRRTGHRTAGACSSPRPSRPPSGCGAASPGAPAAFELCKRLKLRSRIKITEIDHLRWQDFEKQCILLLKFLGYKDAEKTEDRPKLKTVDITATNPDTRKKEVFECKRRKVKPIGVGVVNELIGRVASGMYKGLPLTLMTNARVTDGAREKAAEHGIKVIGREQLAELMARTSGDPGDPTSGRQATAPHDQDAAAQAPAGAKRLITVWFSALRPETKFATAVTGASILAVLIILLQMAVTGPRAAAVAPRQLPGAALCPRERQPRRSPSGETRNSRKQGDTGGCGPEVLHRGQRPRLARRKYGS